MAPVYVFKPENIAVAKLLNEKEFDKYISRSIDLHAQPKHSDALALPTPELTKEQERTVIESVMRHSTAMALSLNNDGIFTVKERDSDTYTVSLNPDAVVSKANYKKLVEIGSQGYENTWRGRWFSKKDMPIRKDQMPELFEINRKTLKYSQETLTTILENRLAGTYRNKFDEGKTWNTDGIGERLGTWGAPREAVSPTPAPVQSASKLSQEELDSGLVKEYQKKKKNYVEMEKWLSKGADVNYGGRYFLEHASIKGDLEAVKIFVKHNASLHITEDTEYSRYRDGALNSAISRKHYDVAKFLIESGADVNEVCLSGEFGGFPLNSAVRNGDMEMVKLLVDHGANVNNHSAKSGPADPISPALFEALKGKHYDVASYLLNKGASDENILGHLIDEDAARDFLKEYNDTQLHDTSKLTQKELDDGLVRAFEEKNYQAMDSWLSKGADVNYKWGDLLETASAKGDLEAVKVLVKHNAVLRNVEEDDDYWPEYMEHQYYVEDDRDGALHMAAYCKHYDVAKFLIESGADVNEASAYSGYPLKAAAGNGDMEMVKLLVENGADVNLYKSGDALSYAIDRDHYDVATYLLDHGASDEKVYRHASKEARDFLKEYHNAQLHDMSKDLTKVEANHSSTHTDIKHFHGHYNSAAEDSVNVRDEHDFQSYGKNRETGKYEHLGTSLLHTGRTTKTTR